MPSSRPSIRTSFRRVEEYRSQQRSRRGIGIVDLMFAILRRRDDLFDGCRRLLLSELRRVLPDATRTAAGIGCAAALTRDLHDDE